MKLIHYVFLLFILLTGFLTGYCQTNLSTSVWKEKEGKYILCDANDQQLSDQAYDNHGEWLRGMTWISLNGKFGFINQEGTEVLPLAYENLLTDFSDKGILAMKNGKWGFINWQQTVIIPFQYDIASDPHPNGVIGVNIGGKNENKVISGGKWGLINKDGKILVAPKYDYIGGIFKDGTIWVNTGGQINDKGNVLGGVYGLIDSTGKEVLPLKYDGEINARKAWQNISEPVTWKQNANKYSLHDKKTNKLLSKTYDIYWVWIDGKACVSSDKKYGYIDKSGKEIIPAVYDDIQLKFSKAGVLVKKENKWGFVDWQNQVMLPFQYDIIGNIADNGLISVCSNQKWGHINMDGEVICPPKYDYVGAQWSEGLLWVNLGGRFNTTDNTVSGGKFGLIDNSGAEVVPTQFDSETNARKAFHRGCSNLFSIEDIIPDNIWNY